MPTEVAFETAPDLALATPFSETFLNVGFGVVVVLHAGHCNHVKCAIQTPVTASVEAMPDGVPTGSGDRTHTGESRECGLTAHPTGV